MEIVYKISADDFINAQRLAMKNSPSRFVRWNRFLPIVGLILLVSLILIVGQQGVSVSLLRGLFFCIWFLAMPFLNRENQRKLYAKNPALHGSISLRIDEDVMHIQGATFSSDIRWDHFSC